MVNDGPLLELLRRLKRLDYRFTTVTPATHARVLARPFTGRGDLRAIFGWNRTFAVEDLDPALLDLLGKADALEVQGAALRSKLRVASLGGDLFLHTAFPTDGNDAVFFGPDTYRFARFLRAQLPRLGAVKTVVDMGAGSGAGGLVAARLVPGAAITLVDVNPAALKLAKINAAAAGVKVELVESSRVLLGDVVIANPPYMIDAARRAYRDGGVLYGGAVALDWARQAAANGSTMLLYTGAAVLDGRMPLLDALRSAGSSIEVEEIDADIFGEELDEPAYAGVERIAAIGAVIRAV